jgi:hypothetical protein
MLVNQNRVLLVVIAVAVGCLVNIPQMKLKDPMMKAGVFGVCLYLSYAFLNSQGLVDVFQNGQDWCMGIRADIIRWCYKNKRICVWPGQKQHGPGGKSHTVTLTDVKNWDKCASKPNRL